MVRPSESAVTVTCPGRPGGMTHSQVSSEMWLVWRQGVPPTKISGSAASRRYFPRTIRFVVPLVPCCGGETVVITGELETTHAPREPVKPGPQLE